MPSKMNEAEARPTLPSIHTLNLPSLASPTSFNVKYQNHDNLVCFRASYRATPRSLIIDFLSAVESFIPTP